MDSLDAVQFLANSTNRVAVLGSLVGRRAGQRDLQEEVGASRSTVARVLCESEKRGWVDSEGSRYWLTPLGEAVVTGFESYLNSIEPLHRLGELVDYFPPPLRELDYQYLGDVTVTRPTPENPAAPFTRAFELFEEATTYRSVTKSCFPHFARVLRDRVDTGHLDAMHVIQRDYLDDLHTDPERAALWASMSDWLWVYEGTVPIGLHVVDGRVVVWLTEGRKEIVGLLEMDGPEALSWAESVYERYLDEATPLADMTVPGLDVEAGAD
jgi:predicted transcriptional regulator